ncbi:cullin-1-like isoform X3 [Carya illinoinensis]|uniref:cullin-1-like isoform X3 n=1 Tax=Carya illinoinensis TaxID=32201 RepID=UPI001C71B833|nr:cullin-1-like isoform X3 [Carya illinoinensis]
MTSISRELYERYKTALEESIVSVVLPSLNDKHDACLLADLLQIWTNYKVMTKCLSGFFLYLDHHFVVRRNFPSLNDLATISFHNLVWSKLYGNFLDAAISLINQDRNGKQVQQDLLKDVLIFSTFFAEIGEQKIEYYEMFEQIMLKEAASYYAQLASELLCCRSYTDYIQTVAWLLIQERERSVRYLQQGSVEKLLEIVKRKLMDETAQLLVEKQKAESHDTATYQDLLSKCAGMSLGGESSVSPLTQCPFLQ